MKSEEYWKGFDDALALLEDLGYCSSSLHEYNIADCVKAKVNRLPSKKIRKTDKIKLKFYQTHVGLTEKEKINELIKLSLEKGSYVESYNFIIGELQKV